MKRPSDNISKQLNFANHVPRITYREISIPGRERPLNAKRHIIGRSHEMVEITTFFSGSSDQCVPGMMSDDYISLLTTIRIPV